MKVEPRVSEGRDGKPWLPAEDEFLAEHWEGLDAWEPGDIGKPIGRRAGSVVSRARALGLKRNPEWLLAKGAWQGVKDHIPNGAKPWPDHRFEDDAREARRPFCPDVRYARRPSPAARL